MSRQTPVQLFYFQMTAVWSSTHSHIFHMYLISRRNVGALRARLDTHFTFENTKTMLFIYVVLIQSLKASRHLRARGLTGTAHEFWRWISHVRGNHILSFHLFMYSFTACHYACPPATSSTEKGPNRNGQS